MLVKYNNSNHKAAMELMSFTATQHKTETLQMIIQKYEEDPNWQLYLWKENDSFIGLIGIELKEYTFTVHHASVIPSYRNEGIGHGMVDKIQQLNEPLAMCSSYQTKDFLGKCWRSFYPI